MLNISENSIQNSVKLEQYKSYQKLRGSKANRMLAWWLLVSLAVLIVISFLPWTQNIQIKGKVTTFNPDERPQTIHSAISGRIEKWYVQEGELVQPGDTIVFLSEVKPEYFDPNLVQRTANQVIAKDATIKAYTEKARALDDQITALRLELIQKKMQLNNKIRQEELKLESTKAMVAQAKIDFEIAEYQYRRTDTLFQQGIKSLTDLEGKNLKLQEARAKLISSQNKELEAENEMANAKLELINIDNYYANQIAKAESEKFSAISSRFDSEGTLNKLSNELENYRRRNNLYYVVAPQECYITQAIKPGIGEIVKEGEPIASIVPKNYTPAVELFVQPMDMPLINIGQEVRFIFDGWPAFIFSGWPSFAVGTFSGKIAAIDNIPNEDSKYRVLVLENDKNKPWPSLLRFGTGAQGIALLKNVSLWYEMWRRLNGFPPEYYDGSVAIKDNKFKPPVKSVAK